MPVNTEFPFPEKPITADVVRAQIEGGDWLSSRCPLCNGDAALWRGEAQDVLRYICTCCQRFTIAGPAFRGLTLALANNMEGARGYARELMSASAASHAIFCIPQPLEDQR